MGKFCRYGRYKDDPEHVGCPRASTDMTPCIARDGGSALTDDGHCVGCNIDPLLALAAVKKAASSIPPLKGLSHAEQLRRIVRQETNPEASND